MPLAIRIDNVSKKYRLGEIGTGTLSHDLHRAWARLLGQPDPFATIGDVNDRVLPVRKNSVASVESAKSLSDYVWALRDIRIDVNKGEILGIIGRNGAGKSTLMKLLSRVTAPTSGLIQCRGRIASLLEVGTGFHPELTGRENIYLNGAILGMAHREITQRLDEIVEFSGCAKYVDTPVKRYSTGMLVRLGFSVAAHLECDILVVDEVLAVGDAEFQQRCIGQMKEVSKSGRTVLFVSHNMGAVSQLCSRCVMLEKGMVNYHGDVDEAISRYLNTGDRSTVEFGVNAASDFQFTRIRVVDEQRCDCTSFAFDDTIRIEFDYNLKHRVEGLEIGVRVLSSQGPLVFTALRSHATNEPLEPGVRTIVMRIPGRFLVSGDYSIDVGAHIPNQRMLDHRENAIGFRVTETNNPYSQYSGQRYGLVNCQCEWNELDQ